MIDAAVAPGCETTGLTEGRHCSVCGEVIVKQEVVSALGHTEVIDAAVASGCETTGLTEGRHCSVCGKVIVKQEVTEAAGHSYEATVVPSTCLEKGHTDYTCSVCGDTYRDEYTDYADHTPGDFIADGNGYRQAQCTVCGETITEKDKVHSGNDWYIDSSNSLFVESGNAMADSAADAYKAEIEKIVLADGITDIADNAFEGYSAAEQIVLPGTVKTIGRNAFSGCDSLTEVVFDGSWQNWTENVSVGSGNDIDDIITFAQPWKYVQVSDGIRLTAHYTNTGYIDIPAEIDGYKVTVVGANLFLNQSGVTGVSFPETVHTIERNAFYNTALTKVEFSQGLVTIGDSAFYNALMFSYEYDTDIILPEGLKTIEKYAFGYTDYRHYYNSELYVPSSVETIGTGAFGYRFAKATYDGTLQQWVDIYGPSVTSTLSGNLAPADTFIAEDDGSAVFTRKYDYNGNMLDEYALVSWTGATGDVTVPSRFRNMPVTMVGRNTFYKNTSVTSVILPESVKQIDFDMFYGCTALEEVHILGNIEGNLSGTFSGCTALKKVTLPGTVYYIGSSTFLQCINLEEVHYPSSWNWYNRVTVDATGNDRLTDDVMVFEHDWGYSMWNSAYLDFLGCTDASGDIVIPAYIDGYPVKYIESYYNSSTDSHIGAFEGNAEITSVVIPEGVTNISVRTFKYCTALESVVIPASIEAINCQMFEGCTNLKEITICGKDTSISEVAQYLPAGVKFNIVAGGWAEIWLQNQGITNINRTVMLESLSAADVRVALGGMVSLPKVSKLPADASGQLDIVWSVADETVAQLTDNGGKQMIQAVSVGVTELTATDRNTGKYTTVKVNVVLPAGENMSLEPDSPIDRIGLENGDVRTITISSPSAGIIPADRLVFTSSNTAAVQVSADGVITSVYTGTGTAKATITATLASDSGEKVTLEVKAIARQTKTITLVPEIPQEYKDRISIFYDEDTLIQTVIVPRDLVKDGNLPFEIKAVGQDKDGNDFAPNVKWTTSDAKVAKIRAVKGATDTATATVLKNVDGITIITATANDMAKAQGILEIDVRDYTPRLETGSVTINTNRTAGAVIPLYTAYDALLESYSPMQLMALEGETRVTNVQLTGNDAFYALYDSENSTITINTDEIVKNATYTLTLHISTAKGETQQTVKVKVANKLPKITLKQTDTFNLFFKDSTADVAVTAAGAVVNSVQLTDCDTFAVTGYENGVFTLAYADSDNPLNGYVSGKADTKAGLKVWLEGYKEAVVVKAFTIKAKETKPGLALSRKSTAYSWLNSENLPLNVIHTVDKNTKVALDFAEYTVSADGSAGFVQLTAAGTDIMLDTLLTSGNKFIDGKTAHTVNLAVNHANWVKPMVLAHKITVNSALPTVKATPATLTMKALYNSTVFTVLVPSVANCPAPARYEITPVNAAQAEQTAKISISSSGWVITAAFADLADLPANGSYKYNVVPVVADESGTEHSLKAVTITVAVNNTLPKIKAEKTTVTLNGAVYSALTETALKADAADCPVPARYEIKAVNAAQQAEIDKLTVYADGWTLYTGFADINNLPANGSYKLAVTAYITNAQGGETALAPVTVTVKVATATPKVTLSKTAVTLSSSLLEDYVIPFRVTEGYVLDNVVVTNGSGNLLTPADISVSFDSLAQAMVVKVNNKALAAGKYKYVLTPVVKLADENATAQTMVKAINLTVTTQARTPVLKTGAKGSIDAANRGTGITYTITGGTNFNYLADEILTDSFCLTGADADKFDIRYAGVNSKGQHMVTVTAKAGAQLATNVKYSYAVQVQVSGMASPVETATFKVGVKQTALKFITAGQTTVYHSYTGTSFFNISVKTPAGAQIGNVQLLDTKATTVPAGALDYTISQNPDGSWKVSYTVERAALLKAGKSYKLAFAITPEGNATNKAPQTLSVTLKIKR